MANQSHFVRISATGCRDREAAGFAAAFRRVLHRHRAGGPDRVRALFMALHRDRVEKRAVRVVQLHLRRVLDVLPADLEECAADVHGAALPVSADDGGGRKRDGFLTRSGRAVRASRL